MATINLLLSLWICLFCNSAAMNILIQVFSVDIIFQYISGSGISGSYGQRIFKFSEELVFSKETALVQSVT